MRKFGLLVGASMALCSAAVVYAQDAETATEEAAEAMEEATEAMEDATEAMEDATEAMEEAKDEVAAAAVAAAEPAAPAVCELHVFPTLEGQAQTSGWLSGLGVVGAIADAAANKDRNMSEAEYLKEALGPKFQMKALGSIDLVSELKLPEGTEIFYETPIADRKVSTKAKTRLTGSDHECYAELLVTQNLYQKKPIYGRSLNNRFIFKDFRMGKEETKMIKGRGGNGLEHFPPKTTDETEAAEADLHEAFTKNFLEYSAKI